MTERISASPGASQNRTIAPALPALGIIAGSRTLPLVLAREARRLGVPRIVAVAFDGETDRTLASLVDDIVWVKVGQLGKMITALTDRSISHCVMAGQIAPKNLFSLRPDLRAVNVLLQLKEKNAQTIFSAIAGELEKEGVQLISAIPWLQPAMPGPGFALGPALSPTQAADVQFGWRIASETARLEIGQTVVVKEGAVLAVEAFEGTDLCLERGGKLAGKEGRAVAIKLARAGHDMRFDIPCLGARTLEVCARSGINVLAFESGRTLLLDEPEVTQLAERRKISVLSVGPVP